MGQRSIAPVNVPGCQRYLRASEGLLIRRMQSPDISTVMRHELECYPFPWTSGIFEDCLRADYPCWVVADSAGEVIGHAVFTRALDEAHLLNLTIACAEQGKGYGRAVLQRLLAWLAEEKTDVVFLEVRPSNVVAQRLYRSLGFEVIGLRRGYYPALQGREDALVFSRRLGAAT
jgi:ribosomal-protein-alanine N-acetyltransferase